MKSPRPRAISDVITRLEQLAPSGTSEKWDNTGLLVGDPAWTTPGAVVSVDLTPEAIELASKRGYRLIVNHHPCIFPKSRGLSRVVAGQKAGIPSLVFDALQKGIAVASYHTNFDQCSMEVIAHASKALGIRPIGRLLEAGGEGALIKLVVFVPTPHVSAVSTALAQAGAGHIGNYDQCTFGTPGQGTYRGLPGSNPTLGKTGKLQKAKETRLETILPRGLKKSVLAALRKAHPYEEIAYDLYPVEQGTAAKGLIRGLGYGFWGDLASPKPFADVARSVMRAFDTTGYLLTDPPSPQANRKIKRLGFVAGKGASFVDAAVAAGCDLFVTGEVGYHAALDGARKGMTVLELGHRESETFFIQVMETWLSQMGLGTVRLNLKTQSIVSQHA